MVVVRGLAVLRNNLNALVLRFIRLGFHDGTIIAAGDEWPQVTEWGGFPVTSAGINETFIENCRGPSIIHTSNTTLGIPCRIPRRVLDSKRKSPPLSEEYFCVVADICHFWWPLLCFWADAPRAIRIMRRPKRP